MEIDKLIELELENLEAENNDPEKTEILKFCLALLQKKGKLDFHKLYTILISNAKKRGLKAYQIAEETGISTNSMSNYKQQRCDLTVNNYEKILNCIIKLSE